MAYITENLNQAEVPAPIGARGDLKYHAPNIGKHKTILVSTRGSAGEISPAVEDDRIWVEASVKALEGMDQVFCPGAVLVGSQLEDDAARSWDTVAGSAARSRSVQIALSVEGHTGRGIGAVARRAEIVQYLLCAAGQRVDGTCGKQHRHCQREANSSEGLRRIHRLLPLVNRVSNYMQERTAAVYGEPFEPAVKSRD